MENSALQKIWKNIDKDIPGKTTAELDLLLSSKAKQTLNKYVLIMSISVTVSLGLLIYLLITSINRHEDVLYLINNLLLGVLTTTSLISGIFSWHKIQNSKYNLPLKDWLKERIDMLSKWLTGKYSKLYLFLVPVLYLLVVMSIHVNFGDKTYIEVLHTEESVIGLIAGTIVGLSVSFFAVRKIRKFQLKNLEFLKDLYGRL